MHRHSHSTAPETRGITIHWAKWYDKLSLWQILTLGRGERLWDEMLDLAGLQPGSRVLDVGCGPGRLTLKAWERVGKAGQAAGIDASPEMIAVARQKAQQAGAPIDFRLEVVEKLPFADQTYDAVLSSLMMHHLPDDVKRQGLAEIRRVLKPGGALVIFDFKRPEMHRRLLSHEESPHGSMSVGVQDLGALLVEAGFEQVELKDAQVRIFGYLRGYR